MNAERVKKHRENNKEHAAEYNRKYKKEFINREENKEKYKVLNRQHVNKHNENKTKAKPKENKEAQNIVIDLLNDLIGTIPKQAELKKKREYMREYRAKKGKQ